ncbi:MAG: hypothetical protein ACTHMI_02070 [Mucilaginibacter sp.]
MKIIHLSIIIFCSCLLSNCAGASIGLSADDSGAISVAQFGANGDGYTDDAAALIKAMEYCVLNNKHCYIPKTKAYYNIGSTIRIPLKPGQSLNIISNGAIIKPNSVPINSSAWNLTGFKEHIFLSIGNQLTSYKDVAMYKFSEGSAINISGLIFDGGSFLGPLAPTSLSTDIFIGLQALAEIVNVNNCVFKNIYGYGMTIYNVKNSAVNRCKFYDVGGRGATPFAQKIDRDAFGDGVHYSLVKPDGVIKVQNSIFQGKKSQGKRSRDAVTFEFSTLPYQIFLTNDDIAGFAKCLHIEETAPTTVHIDHVNMSDFNFGIANIVNDQTVIYLNNVRMDVGMIDGNDQGDALAFLSYRSKARIYVNKSYLNFNGKKQAYQSAIGLVKVENSTINGNNTNFFFADGSTDFDNCVFIGFGGAGKSFSSNTGKGVYRILNSKIDRSSTIHANGQNLKLSINSQ